MLTGIAAAFFYLFAFIMIVSALMVVTARNPVHSVLFLILAFFNGAALFLLTGAEFLAMILVVVYVGAVAVLFLFVVMMLDVDFAELKKGAMKHAPVGALIGVVLLAELILVFSASIFSPNFEVAGLILLVAMIGAIVLTLRHKPGIKRQSIPAQVARTPETAIEIKKVESGKGI